MYNLEKLVSILSQYKALFAQYEEQTDLLVSSDEDSANNYITKRGELAIEIDNIKSEIDKLLIETADSKVSSAVKCKGNYQEYPPELAAVYDIARETYAIMSRITDKNAEIVETMSFKRDELREKLASTKNTPTIKKYLGALGSTVSGNMFMGTDKKA